MAIAKKIVTTNTYTYIVIKLILKYMYNTFNIHVYYVYML